MAILLDEFMLASEAAKNKKKLTLTFGTEQVPCLFVSEGATKRAGSSHPRDP